MSRRPERLPIWMSPEPGGRRPRFTREAIARAALEIADREGFEAVSMRAIAARLGAGTMTLYHYVRTKDDLVALMDDALMGEVIVPGEDLPRDWRGALTAIARRTRAIFVKHPWALLAMRGAPPGPNGARHFEQCLAALAPLALPRAEVLAVLALIDDFVFGHALRAGEARQHGGTDPEVVKAYAEYGKRQLETGQFPHTAALFGGSDPAEAMAEIAGSDQDEARFERGLKAILDGAEANMPITRKRSPRRTMNAAWHARHPMPGNATLEQRIAWHREHQGQCGCRPIPAQILEAMKGSPPSSRPRRGSRD